MIGLEDRRSLAREIDTAHRAGARLREACAVAGIDVRTLQRWRAEDGLERGDRRPAAVRPTPAHALSAEEREQLLRVANEPRFADLPPARIVPTLADQGVYLASESSFQRVLRAEGQTWSWDMTYLPAAVLGHWFYLYLILDVFSRKIVGFEVHDSDDSLHAAHLLKRTALAEGVHAMADKPVLHGDNGATLKATTVLTMLHWLGIKPSYSRPRVSDDNAFVESLFRTAKYRPEFPARGFADLEAAREWAQRFVHWYNHDHRHSGIRYVSPAQRHEGLDRPILARRHALYLEARARHPRRWSRHTRNWSPIEVVTLNPEREAVAGPVESGMHKASQAA